ncbi:MAG: hypothetical protein JF616_13185 [Fibrobacteres bacterium]|nr:hypothetical protein [Fibrobacterota bacterium]
MNKRFLGRIVLAGWMGFAFAAAAAPPEKRVPYDYRPADLGQARPQGGAMIMPGSFLREYDPITILYGRDLNPKAPGPLDRPDSLVTLKPSQPGEWRWLDPRTIEFRPAVPWKPMQAYVVKAGGESKTLTALLTPPLSISPAGGSEGLEPFSRVELEFSQPVAPEVLAKLVTFEATPLPGIESKNARVYGPAEYHIKSLEKGGPGSARYAFIFPRPFANGQRIRTVVRLAADPSLSDAKRVYSADTRREFTLDKAGTFEYQFTLNSEGSNYGRDQAIRLPDDGSLILDFSAKPEGLSLSQVKSLLNFSPAPRRMDWSLSQKRITVKLSVDQERLYQVTLAPTGIVDGDGRKLHLDHPCRFWIYQPLDRQYARWGLGQGLLERYGPQHFPLLVNGVKSLDLRIYKISAKHKAFWPYPDEPVRVDESQAPPGPGEEPEREQDILRPLGAFEMDKHIRMLGAPHYSAVIDLDQEGVTRFQSLDLKPLFAKISGADKPGAYLVGFRPLDGTTERAYVRLLVTDLALTTVEAKRQARFAVTSVSTGKPVADAEIQIEGAVKDKLEVLAKGRTDADGMFAVEHTQLLSGGFEGSSLKRVTVRKDDDMLVLDTRPGEAPPSFANNHWAGSQSGSEWLSWLARDPYDYAQDKVPAGFVFTERPIYRPDEHVYFKGIARTLFHGKVEAPDAAASYSAVVESPAGLKYEFHPRLSASGTFNDSLVEKNLPTGDYSLRLLRHHPKEGESEVASTGFAIEAYKLPKFEIKLQAPDKAQNDRPVSVKLNAAYYAGGKVAGQNVAWRVVSYPFAYAPDGVAGFILSTDARYGGAEPEHQEGALEQKDVTDDNGQAVLAVNPQSATGGNPRKYLIEATVTDADEQTVSNRTTFVALPPFILALKTERHIAGGSTIKAEVAALGVDGKFEAGHKVSVQLKKMSWIAYLQETDFSRGKPKYRTRESIDLIGEKPVTTGSAPVPVEFGGQEPGVFVLELSSRDRLGRLQTVKADLFLAGNKPVTWKKGEQALFETVPDKEKYLPGQEARILLKSPFQKARALAVIERPAGEPEYRWVDIADGQGTLTLSIGPEMAPRIPVDFLLMRPRIGNEKRIPDGTVVDAARPQTLGNTTWLKVEPTGNLLKVALEHPQTVRPGTRFDMTVSLKDDQGNPRPGEVALWLVDEAVLSLRKEKPLDPLPSFLPQVESHVSLRDTRNLIMGDLRVPENPGGDGNGGPDAFFGKMTVRKNFKTVPYWNPAIPVDKSGKATVSIAMSDDLTNFAVRAVAVSAMDRFGQGSSQVRVRLPVLVQPALPRFVRLGDRFMAGGVARVVEGPGGAASWSIDAQGLKATLPAAVSETNLIPDKPTVLRAEMQVEQVGFDAAGRLKRDSVGIRMAVERKSDKAGDAFAVSIPLKSDRPLESENVFAQVTPGKPLSAPAIAGAIRPGTLARDLAVSDQLGILKALAAMTSLVGYPYGCAEQRLSQAYPAVAYRDIWAKFGLEPPMPDVKRSVAATVDYLSHAQAPDGLIGYWPGSTGYLYLTAYAVEFLSEVKQANAKSKAGYPFDDAVYKKAIDALKRGLRTDYTRFIEGQTYYERSCALYALALAGELDVGYARELAGAANDVDVQSQAQIYQALLRKPDALKAELAALRERLWKQTVFKQQDGKEVFAGLQQRSFRIGARVHADEITALATLVSAFSAEPQRPPKLPMLVDELVSLGDGDSWGSTAENGLGLLAMRDFLSGPSGNGQVTGTLACGGSAQRMAYDRSKGAFATRCADAGKLELRIDAASVPVYARLTQRWMPAEPGSQAPAVQKGFVVKRELIYVRPGQPDRHTPLDAPGSAQSLQVGDIIEDHIQVQNPVARHWVAVTAPFAAGMEYLNPRLETSGEDAKPKGATTNSGDYQAFLDDGATWFFESLPEGTYDFYFRVRASVEGAYSLPSARAEMMYEMGNYGTSPGAQVAVRPAP